MAKYQSHGRSTSLRSTLHPLTASVEEHLNGMRDWVALTSSSKYTKEGLQDGFGGLIHLYESIEDFVRLPQTQQVLAHHRDEKSVEKVLDGSVRLLDVSGTTRDVLLEMQEHVQQIQTSLRRRRGKFNFKSEIDAYALCRKKVNKVINKNLQDMRKMGSKLSLSILDKDHNLVAVISVLLQVEAITLSVFESLLFFMSGRTTILKSHSWGLVSKFMESKRILSEVEHEGGNEFVNAEAAVLGLSNHNLCLGNEVATVTNVEKRLQALEASIRSLQDGLESVLKRLIKARVSVLNILSN